MNDNDKIAILKNVTTMVNYKKVTQIFFYFEYK